jgi:uncharacterized protein
MLLALDMYLGPTPEIVIVGSHDEPANAEVLGQLHRRFLPNKVVAFRPAEDGATGPALAGTFRDKHEIPPGPTLFICHDLSCQSPVSGKEAALAALDNLARA